MTKSRVNPFPRGSAEHVLYGKLRQARLAANTAVDERNRADVEAKTQEAKAREYADAMKALGHELPDTLPEPKITPTPRDETGRAG